MIARSWTWIDENKVPDEQEIERLKPRLDALAQEWSSIATKREDAGFRRQAMIEDGEDFDFETEEEAQAFRKQQSDEHEHTQVRVEIIEEMLARNGARMMRPYEHWNEDERYMEYMENRCC